MKISNYLYGTKLGELVMTTADNLSTRPTYQMMAGLMTICFGRSTCSNILLYLHFAIRHSQLNVIKSVRYTSNVANHKSETAVLKSCLWKCNRLPHIVRVGGGGADQAKLTHAYILWH